MREKDGVNKLTFDDEFLLDSAEKRLKSGDYFGALTMLNKRAGMYAPSADASALYADTYEAMGLWELAADSWFRFLDTCNEADFIEGYEGLAVAFMNMGNDMQAALYYHRILAEGGELSEFGQEELSAALERASEPMLRVVHSAEDGGDPDALQKALVSMKLGDFEGAREQFQELPPGHKDFSTAAGLAAMCSLMLGDEDAAERECKALLTYYPDNVQALTTYCAVLGARDRKEEAREVAKKLATLRSDAVDDMYRIATALCETELDEEAFECLSALKERLPYDENVLWFHAVSGYRSGKIDEAIQSLETLTTVYPRKAVANFYLVKMRKFRDGEAKRFSLGYFYRVPEEYYRAIADLFLRLSNEDDDEALLTASEIPELPDFFRIAFDEMEGRDEKLQMLAVKIALKCQMHDLLREILLDYQGDDGVKLAALHGLVMRNEDDSFGTVICATYKEFFTHKLELGERKRTAFLRAFADVYSKYALLDEVHESKLCTAAEDIYQTLEEAEAWSYMDERAALSAAIYREARLPKAAHSLSEIAKLFDASSRKVKEILDFMM